MVVSATAKDSSDAGALTIQSASTESFTINLTLCKQKLSKGASLPTMPAIYSMAYPSGSTQTFPGHYIFTGTDCATPETTYTVALSPTPTSNFVSVATTSPFTVTIDSSLYSGLPGT